MATVSVNHVGAGHGTTRGKLNGSHENSMNRNGRTGEPRGGGAPGVLSNRSPMLAWQAAQAQAQAEVGPCPHCAGRMEVIYSAEPKHPKALIARCVHLCGHEHLVYVANVGPFKYSEPYRPDPASTAAAYDQWARCMTDGTGDTQARWESGLTPTHNFKPARLPGQPLRRRPVRD